MTTPDISSATESNLHSALSLSLLLLPHRQPFTEFQLWEQIAGLSYSGDPRMSVPGAENPQKVRNIVRGQGNLQGFRTLYDRAIKTTKGLRWEGTEKWEEKWEWRGHGDEMMIVSNDIMNMEGFVQTDGTAWLETQLHVILCLAVVHASNDTSTPCGQAC